MLPILYDTITEGIVPTNYGVGVLTDAIKCQVKEERNGAFELALEYPATGIHAEDIAPNKFIKAKPNYMDDPQIFRIYKVGKVMAGKFTVNARHISYDLSGKIITNGTAGSCAAACALLQASAGNFIISTDKTLSGAFRASQPASVRSWFGGKEGSILDVYGPGEWKYDNYTASFKAARGQNRGVTIRYGKNLTQLSQELDMSNLATAVLPYYVDQSGAVTMGTKTPTGLTLDVDREIAVDFSNQIDQESATPITTQLNALAANYIANTNLTTLTNSITLDFVQLEGITERVDLCDTVNIYFEALGITAQAKCVATTWDVLADRYTKTTFGDPRTNIADTIANVSKKTQQAITREEMNVATQLITGNLGGYVLLDDSDGDGKPDQILVMDTADKATATKVWRWNKAGLGYSSTGYEGPYGLAMLSTGEIDADFIKAGVISDVQGNSTIDMTNGEAILNQLKAKQILTLIDSNNINRGHLSYTVSTGAGMMLREPSGQATVAITAGTSNDANISLLRSNGTSGLSLDVDATFGGHAAFFDTNNKKRIQIDPGVGIMLINPSNKNTVLLGETAGHGGKVNVNTSAADLAATFFANSGSGGLIIYNGSSSIIDLDGNNGRVTCVSLVQTSSRKVKENIAPIEDAEKILELEAVRFDYKNKATGTDKRGFIAENVAEILPNLVTPEEEGRPASLDYVGMIPYLQAVLKAQAEEIKELKAKIEILEG